MGRDNALLSMPTVNIEPINPAKALMTAEAIKGQRIQNQTAGLQNQLLQKRLTDTRGETIKYESDLIDYAMKSANLSSFEEYPQFRSNLVRLGLSPKLLPESFDSPEAYTKWKSNFTMSGAERLEMLKLSAGATKFKMSKREDDGRVSTVEVKTPEEFAQFQAQGYSRGELSGKPEKEKWSAPQKGMINGKPGFFRVNSDTGEVQPVTGAEPIDKSMKVYDSNGNLILDTSGSAGDLAGAPKGAQTELFKDVVQHQQEIDSIRNIRNLYEPEFLTYKGSAKGAWATFLNKLDPNDRSQFQQRRSVFLSDANKAFIAYRKWATGVAGGEKEMAEIKRATFSEDDSPQDFESKLQGAENTARRLNARIKAALKAGVNNEKAFQQFIQANPLDGIPTMQQRGDQLEKQGYKPGQVMAILVSEGYMTGGAPQRRTGTLWPERWSPGKTLFQGK